MKEFKGKVAVITGASSGIGYGIAEKCAKEGMKVVLAGINHENLENAKNNLEHLGAEIARTHFRVKVIDRANVYCRIVRADEAMLVTKYLCHSSGGTSPTLELHGKDTSWFRKFVNEFDRMWELAAE